MADEHKTDNEKAQTPPNSEDVKKADITQEKLDSLINGSYAKGAEKATKELLESLGVESQDKLKEIIEAKKQQEDANKTELEKMKEQLEALNQANQKLISESESVKAKTVMQELALKNSVNDLEVFELLYDKASKVDNFNSDDFIKGLRESRGGLFGEADKKVKTDSSPNKSNEPKDFADRVKQAKTKAELDKLYAEIGA